MGGVWWYKLVVYILLSAKICTTFCQEEGILLQKHRDRNGRCIAILFKSIGVKGRFDYPEIYYTEQIFRILLMGGMLMGGTVCERLLHDGPMFFWPSGERHCTVMEMLHSFGLPWARQGVSHLFGGTVFCLSRAERVCKKRVCLQLQTNTNTNTHTQTNADKRIQTGSLKGGPIFLWN